MAKIAFFGSVYRGHNVAPTGFINTMIDRGHEVTYFGLAKYSDLVQNRTHTNFISYPDFDKLSFLADAKLPTTGDASSRLLFLTETTVNASSQIIPWIENMFLTQELDVDLVIYDNMALWGYVAAEKLGINNMCSLTLMATNRAIMTELGQGSVYLTLSPSVSEPLNLFHNQGVSGIKDFVDIMTCGYNANTILYTSPLFQHNADFFIASNYVFFPPKCQPVTSKKPFDADNVEIYLSFGTVYNNDIDLFTSILDQLHQNEKYKITVTAGGSANTFNALQTYQAFENVKIVKFANQDQMLLSTDIFITHAGMNSAGEAICNTVPMVAIPLVGDQNDVAISLARLGAARVIPRNKLVEQTQEAVEDVVNNHNVFVDNLGIIRDSFADQELLGATLNRIDALAGIGSDEL